MQVVCVKWGDKYSADYVNKLYSMVSRFAPSPFQFACLTDNPTNVSREINCIEFPPNNDLELWWNKMYMFDVFRTGPNLFFDLDVVIHSSLDFFFTYDPTTLTVIQAAWKDPLHTDRYDTFYNSSVVMWNDASQIYNDWDQDRDRYMSIYKGIDRYLWNEKIAVDTFPPGHVYSYWKGASLKDQVPEKYRSDHSVCILNHTPKPHNITKSWIHDYWK